MVERARGKGNLRTKTITMYCVLIIYTLIILKFSEDLYIRGILKGI
jgi:hypothetical protein